MQGIWLCFWFLERVHFCMVWYLLRSVVYFLVLEFDIKNGAESAGSS